MRSELWAVLSALVRLHDEGSYHEPVGKLSEDLGWERDVVRTCLMELKQEQFVELSHTLAGDIEGVWVSAKARAFLEDKGRGA